MIKTGFSVENKINGLNLATNKRDFLRNVNKLSVGLVSDRKKLY